MNLVKDPWISVLTLDGAHRSVSLQEAFADGDTIADLALNPCQRIAVMRLLICIAQAALDDGPADESDWAACRPRLRDAALAYLDKWQPRFELFGEGAFLQVEELAPEVNALADKLDLTAACGNNPTLFDHEATADGRTPSPAKLALDLLVYQVYSPGGLIGQLVWNGKTTDKSSELAPALEGSLLHTVIRGATLFDTIYFNLLHHSQVGAWGQPTWTIDHLRRDAMQKNAGTYLGRLIPACRAIRCLPRSPEITLANAITCPKLPQGRESMATVVKRKRGKEEGVGYVAVNLAKHPWRELGSLLAFSKADNHGGALALAHLRGLPAGRFDIWTGGLAADKSKLLDMAEWSFSLPHALLDTNLLAQYQNGVERANEGVAALALAVSKYGESLNDSTPSTDLARTLYWSALDRDCRILVDTAADPVASLDTAWFPCIYAAMRDAYERACPHETPRQIQAYAIGLRHLRLRPADRRADSLRTRSSVEDAEQVP
jgi:CRISPR system Cascade subunit CasA